MKLGVKQIDKRSVLPKGDIFDIYMVDTVKIAPNETRIIRTGLELTIPAGSAIVIIPKLSLGAKHDLIIPSGHLVVASGELIIPIRNIDRFDQLTVKAGAVIAQGVLVKLEQIDYEIQKLP